MNNNKKRGILNNTHAPVHAEVKNTEDAATTKYITIVEPKGDVLKRIGNKGRNLGIPHDLVRI